MIRHYFLIRYICALIFSASLFFFLACENKQGKDPKEVAQEENKPMDDATKERDENFLVKAAEINMEEIQLGQLAQQKGTLEDVKSLGKMMEDQHSQAMSDLHALASRKGIAIPTATTDKVKNAYDNLNQKAQGNDFDKAFCDMMVSGHNNAINEFENAANNAADAEIRSWASSMLPTLRTHLDQAKACDEKLKQM